MKTIQATSLLSAVRVIMQTVHIGSIIDIQSAYVLAEASPNVTEVHLQSASALVEETSGTEMQSARLVVQDFSSSRMTGRRKFKEGWCMALPWLMFNHSVGIGNYKCVPPLQIYQTIERY
jgi:hypothetical protein